MFGSDDDNKVSIIVLTSDGQQIEGKIDGGPSKSMAVGVNREGDFLELIVPGGEKKLISKRFIVSVERAEQVKKPELNRVNDEADPYNVLGIARDADATEIKSAYLKLCKQYHPDTYEGRDMPNELRAYVDQMFKLVNQAYRQVSSSSRHAA